MRPSKKSWRKIAGVYLILRTSGHLYAGESNNMANRYDKDTLDRVVAFVPEREYTDRIAIEKEAIEFLQAFGIPSGHLDNIQHNGNRANYRSIRRKAVWGFQ
jgi:hypothetical protein